MKPYAKLLIIVPFVSLSSVALAQNASESLSPFSPAKPFGEITKPDLKLNPVSPSAKIDQLPFTYHLPPAFSHKNQTLQTESQGDQAHNSNMPVIKPGKTSKILVARLDPEWPYTYNMPIVKPGETSEVLVVKPTPDSP